MQRILTFPSLLYQRHQPITERLVAVVGLCGLVFVVLQSLPVYPPDWDIVILVAILLLGLWLTAAAYYLTVVVLLYPLYSISLYLAIIFLAVAILGQWIIIRNLGLAVLVAATPLLAQGRLEAIVPFLAGLWWGVGKGAWAAALAAFWGKLVGGMGGLNIDWLVLSGGSISVQRIVERFASTNSLQTLLLLVEPFAPDSTVLLFHLLQITGWAVAAAFVGLTVRQHWLRERGPWAAALALVGGAGLLAASYLLLPYWLELAAPALLWAEALPLAIALALSAGIVMMVNGAMHLLNQPPPRPTYYARKKEKREVARQPRARAGPVRPPPPPPSSPPPPPPPSLPAWEEEEVEEDLIMIELD
jgi:hypothetical protein